MQIGKTSSLVRIFRAPTTLGTIALALVVAFSLAGRAEGATLTVGTDCATIQDCIDLAVDGDTVSIPAGTYTESVTINNKAVSLVGTGAATTTVEAAAGRVLTITGGAVDSTVVIEGLTLRNGDVSGGNLCHAGDHTNCGGGILITDGAAPVLQHLVIEDNRAYVGGGLFADGGTPLSLDDVSFLDNASVLSAGGAYFQNGAMVEASNFERNVSENNVGGGIRAAGDLTIYDSSFIDNMNTAAGFMPIAHGGAIYAFEANVTIENSVFEGNSCLPVNCDGGAIYLSTSFVAISLSLTDTDFTGNSAGRSGGAVLANVVSLGGTGNIDVVGGTFEDNHSMSNATAFADGGGGLSARGDTTIDGTQFIDNSAVDAGGGAIIQGAVSDIANAHFEGNTALRGGAIASRPFGPSQQLVVTDTDVVNNVAEEDGGGIWVEFGGATITGGTIDGNVATEGNGGGIWVQNGLTVDGTTISNNSAGEDGGGFVLVAGNGGGAFVSSGDINLTGGVFKANSADGTSPFSEGGGGLYAANGNLTANGTSFIANVATAANGAGLLVFGDIALTGARFEDNEAANVGGGLAGGGNIDVNDSEFVRNSALAFSGGAILTLSFSAGPSVLVDGSTFTENTAAGAGGAISSSLPTTILDSTFTMNSATGFSGGAMSVFETLDVADSLFESNTAAASGGAIAGSFDPVSISGSDFFSNEAATNGGAVNANGALGIDSSSFFSNVSNGGRGGAASTSGQATVTGDSEFIGNTAAGAGGAIWANSGGSAQDSLFQANASGAEAGAWASLLGQVGFDTVRFLQNHADSDAGAVFTFDISLITETTFEENTSDARGGALFVRRGRDELIERSLFARNEAATAGGAIFHAGDAGGATTRRLNIQNSTVSGNTAPTGAGIAVENSRDPTIPTILTLHNLTFAENDGDAIDAAADTSVELTNILVSGTCAGNGAFVSNGGNLESIGNTCALSDPSDQTGVSAIVLNLGPLADNGGSTQTHALLTGSPALDAGVAPCPAIDQRGVPRIDGACDIGAYEEFVALLDIHPGSEVNPINLKKKGFIPVALLGAAGFNVSDVDVTTLRFGPGGALPVHDPSTGHYEDVNSDGNTDLVLHFAVGDTAIALADTHTCLEGETLGGDVFIACDAIRVK